MPRAVTLCSSLALLSMTPPVAASVTFHMGVGPDATADLTFQSALGGACHDEFDLEQYVMGDAVTSLAGQDVVADITLENADGTPGSTPPRAFVAPWAFGFPGEVFNSAVLNGETPLMGPQFGAVAAPRIVFSFSKPVRGFGGFLWDDASCCKQVFVLRAEEVGGQVTVSPPLDKQSPGGFIAGFLGAVSDVGIVKVVVEAQTANGQLSPHFFEMDHLQIGSFAGDRYGQGCPGSGGFTPTLGLSGCALAGSSVTLNVEDGLGGGTAILLFGTQPASLPMGFGCSLNVSPLLPIMPSLPLTGAGPGDGAASLTAPLPANATGLTVTGQVFVVDPGGAGGFSNSMGLEFVIH